MSRADLTGRRFGRLVALRELAPKRWLCRCDCGNESTPSPYNLLRGKTRSCGCGERENRSRMRIHGCSGSREHDAWISMRQRCSNPKTKQFHDYGGRGIKVCEQWNASFETFLADMGPCPPGHSLDRIDNNGHYEPDNCRWASRKEQQNNTRRNRIITYNGQSLSVTEWARRLGISDRTISNRIHTCGISNPVQLLAPPRRYGPRT